MKIGLITVFVIFLNLLCTPKIGAQTIITMEKHDNLNVVPCKVNDIPMKFIFDTGASTVSISLTEARFLLKK
jgi:predicted aspartyl protease